MIINQVTEVGEFNDYLSPTSDELEVDQGEWRYSSESISTFPVVSCVAVAAHNETTKRGLIGHFSSISRLAQLNRWLRREHLDTDAFNQAIDFLPTLGPLPTTYLWLGGAALHTEESPEIQNAILADRRYAEDRITDMATRNNLSKEQITLSWNKTEYDLYIHLNCRTGLLLIQPVVE